MAMREAGEQEAARDSGYLRDNTQLRLSG